MNTTTTRSLSLCALASATLLAFASPARAGALSYVLPMDADPSADGWTLQTSGGAHAVGGGILSIDTPGFRQFDAPMAIWDDTVSNADGWSAEARLRLFPSFTTDTRVQMWLMDDVNFNKLEVYQDRVELRSGFITMSYSMDTTSAFHIYEVVAQGTNTKLFVDGVEQISIDWVTSAAATFTMNFGDGHGSHPSDSQWDYVAIRHNAIPAPGAAALMTIAFGCLTRRRR